jgi:L-aspartate oxidase
MLACDHENVRPDILILGSGIAGLYASLKLKDEHDVTIITKNKITESNTEHAQGGIAVALSLDDSPNVHFEDTIKAGAGLCNIDAVKIMAEKGPDCVKDLIHLGTRFDRVNNELDFTREAAHSKKRVLHALGDATGSEIERSLVEIVSNSPQIFVAENTFAIDLLRNKDQSIAGVLVFNEEENKMEAWLAKAIILATGGLGQLYKYTTNPEVATGDGLAAAYRAGAELMDMEFVQFHPTALLIPGVPSFLISEAARGEGAKLVNQQGERFMENVPGKELAPRDVVARAIWSQMKDGQVYLDFTYASINRLEERFPKIAKTCLQYGIDITKSPVPVGPAAHYMMGGIKVNNSGETNLTNLYACGECSCSGLHGANRLASNSLLDGLVFSAVIAETIKKKKLTMPSWDEVTCFQDSGGNRELRERSKGNLRSGQLRAEVREIMWEKVGIIRNEQGLREGEERLEKYYNSFWPSLKVDEMEIANMLELGLLIIEAAINRRESRGGHFRSDYPLTDGDCQKHCVQKKGVRKIRYESV